MDDPDDLIWNRGIAAEVGHSGEMQLQVSSGERHGKVDLDMRHEGLEMIMTWGKHQDHQVNQKEHGAES